MIQRRSLDSTDPIVVFISRGGFDASECIGTIFVGNVPCTATLTHVEGEGTSASVAVLDPLPVGQHVITSTFPEIPVGHAVPDYLTIVVE